MIDHPHTGIGDIREDVLRSGDRKEDIDHSQQKRREQYVRVRDVPGKETYCKHVRYPEHQEACEEHSRFLPCNWKRSWRGCMRRT
jgi:hypothetical protein